MGLFISLADLLKMKRSGDIASLFQKYESQKKDSSPSPSLAAAVPEVTYCSSNIIFFDLFFNYYGYVIFQFYVKKVTLIYFRNSPFFYLCFVIHILVHRHVKFIAAKKFFRQ